MRIVLVNPSVHLGSRYLAERAVSGNFVDYLGAFQPLGLLSIAAVLRRYGYTDIHVVDAQAENLPAARTALRVAALNPDLVGVSCVTFSFLYVLEFAHLLKAQQCAAPVVAGGPHVGIYPGEVLSHTCFDAGIVGEGEYPFLELARTLAAGRPLRELRSLPGLAFRDNGGITLNPPAAIPDLDSLPLPARDLLPQKRYSDTWRHAHFTSLLSTRGCPHRCSYCSHFPLYDNVRFLSPARVVEEMRDCVVRHKTRFFQFFDDTFLLDKRRVLEICRLIRQERLDIGYMVSTRVDLLDDELARALKGSGCRCVSLGVESGDQGILDSLQKGITVEQSAEALRLCRAHGMESIAFFLVGAPGETRETVRNTQRFIRRTRPSWLKANVLVPYPASPLYERMVSEGRIRDFWREMTLSGTAPAIPPVCEGLSARELRGICTRLNLMPYLRGGSNLFNLAKLRHPRDVLWSMKWVGKLAMERLRP